jgi:very-short-patch-repair endonuclease
VDGFGWLPAGECCVDDRIMIMANRCKRCNKLIPYFRKYCSRSCLSKDITEQQWNNPMHRRNISEKARKQMLREYGNGVRDRNKITQAANEKTRQMVKDGEFGYWMDDKFFEKIRQVTNTEEHRKASSRRMKENNPMHNPEYVIKAQRSLEKQYRLNPEKRLNARMAKFKKSGNMTSIERLMGDFLDELDVNYIYQYPILRYDVDFAIPDLRIVIECDGQYWHKDEKSDLLRQQRIEAENWTLLRFSDDQINNESIKVKQELSRVLMNHTKQYEFITWSIEKMEKYVMRRNRTLFNLTVDEDESYIVKGVVVHNCRCIALPYKERK